MVEWLFALTISLRLNSRANFHGRLRRCLHVQMDSELPCSYRRVLIRVGHSRLISCPRVQKMFSLCLLGQDAAPPAQFNTRTMYRIGKHVRNLFRSPSGRLRSMHMQACKLHRNSNIIAHWNAITARSAGGWTNRGSPNLPSRRAARHRIHQTLLIAVTTSAVPQPQRTVQLSSTFAILHFAFRRQHHRDWC